MSVCLCILVSKRYEKRYPVCLSPKSYLPYRPQQAAGGPCVNDTPISFSFISILRYEYNIKGTLRPQQVGGVWKIPPKVSCYALCNIRGSRRASQSAAEASLKQSRYDLDGYWLWYWLRGCDSSPHYFLICPHWTVLCPCCSFNKIWFANVWGMSE